VLESKIGKIPIHRYRDIAKNATIKQVTIEQEPAGEWCATFGIDVDEATPEKPETPEKVVGIDVGICKYAHDTDGYAIESPNFSEECKRLERAKRNLSRGTRFCELGETTEGCGRMPCRPEAKASRFPPQTLELLCHRVRLGGGGGLGHEEAG
jgi:transposase